MCGFIFCIYIPFNFNFTLIGLNDVGCLIRALKNSELEPKFEFIYFFFTLLIIKHDTAIIFVKLSH